MRPRPWRRSSAPGGPVWAPAAKAPRAARRSRPRRTPASIDPGTRRPREAARRSGGAPAPVPPPAPVRILRRRSYRHLPQQLRELGQRARVTLARGHGRRARRLRDLLVAQPVIFTQHDRRPERFRQLGDGPMHLIPTLAPEERLLRIV